MTATAGGHAAGAAGRPFWDTAAGPMTPAAGVVPPPAAPAPPMVSSEAPLRTRGAEHGAGSHHHGEHPLEVGLNASIVANATGTANAGALPPVTYRHQYEGRPTNQQDSPDALDPTAATATATTSLPVFRLPAISNSTLSQPLADQGKADAAAYRGRSAGATRRCVRWTSGCACAWAPARKKSDNSWPRQLYRD